MHGHPIQVLLVEDDPDDVLLIEDMLDEGGDGLFQLCHAGRLTEGIRQLEESGADVVLLDLSLPDSQGFDTFVNLQTHAPDVPIVVLTGLSDKELAVQAVQKGAQDYLVKGQATDDLLVRALRYAIERHQLLAERMERVDQEMKLAAEIQKEFLPTASPKIKGLELGGHFHPSGQIGGDFYDFLELSSQQMGVAVGDAAGKGIPGALLIAKAQGVLRAQVENIDQISEVMGTLNRLLCRGNEVTRFVTLFYAVLDQIEGQITYVNAGHPPAFLFYKKETIHLSSNGPPLGMFPDTTYSQHQVAFSPEDLLVIYSDGVPEAQNSQGVFFDHVGIQKVVGENRSLSASLLARAICKTAEQFEKDSEETPDDKTVLVVRRA